jgi:hypothetical protein
VDAERQPLTEKRAREILRPPLIFGDPEQICAKKFLEDLEDAADAWLNCSHGSGYECGCLIGFETEVLAALQHRIATTTFRVEA